MCVELPIQPIRDSLSQASEASPWIYSFQLPSGSASAAKLSPKMFAEYIHFFSAPSAKYQTYKFLNLNFNLQVFVKLCTVSTALLPVRFEIASFVFMCFCIENWTCSQTCHQPRSLRWGWPLSIHWNCGFLEVNVIVQFNECCNSTLVRNQCVFDDHEINFIGQDIGNQYTSYTRIDFIST